MKKLPFYLFLGIVLFSTISLGFAQTETKELPYAQGQIVLKLKNSINTTQIQGVTSLNSIASLNKNYHLQSIRPLFSQQQNVTPENIINRGSASQTQTAEINSNSANIYILNFPKDSNIEEIVRRYQNDPYIEYAHPNYLIKLNFTPDDPFFSSSSSWGQDFDDLWGLKKMQIESAWDKTQGEG
ncbi:MAG: hypothetical protein KC733_04640, partial [Candidatus Omnitrophica bacterium]|nr:hypothetical protein [Candidatus Omnitrophota bacterium]